MVAMDLGTRAIAEANSGAAPTSFNPFHPQYKQDLEEIKRQTIEYGGTTYNPSTMSFVPVTDRPGTPGVPDVFAVGGAPDPQTGRRFPTNTALNQQQFTPGRVADTVWDAVTAAHITKDPTYSVGGWAPDESNPRHGQYDLDVVDLQRGGPRVGREEHAALRSATRRGEEEIFRNQGMYTVKTRHSPTRNADRIAPKGTRRKKRKKR